MGQPKINLTKEETDKLHRDVTYLLPDNTGFILITLPIGVPAAPTFVSNMEREDSTYTMRKILEVIDQSRVQDTNGD